MTRYIDSLDQIADRYDALFCDLWGCLHNGYDPFPEAVAALQRFRAGGGTVLLLTNSPRPRHAVERQLAKIGVARDAWDEIASSGDAAQAGLIAGVVGRRVFHLGPPHDKAFFTDVSDDVGDPSVVERVSFEEAEGIVCTGLLDDMHETPDDYRLILMQAKQRGLKLLCANPDIVVDRGDKRIWCAGALARDYTEMGGTSLYFGKPHPPIYDLAMRRLDRIRPGTDRTRILCVGDGILTDISGAMGDDLDSLFLTGGLAAGDLEANGQLVPDKVADYYAHHGVMAQWTTHILR